MPAVAKAAWDEIAPALDVLEIALGKAQWLAGSEFTVADLNVAVGDVSRADVRPRQMAACARMAAPVLGPPGRQAHAGDARVAPRFGEPTPGAINTRLGHEREPTMLTRRWDKSRMPSRHVTVGPDRAPHRSYYYAMGLTEDEIDQPFVGVATCWNEAAPCNIALSRQAQSVKKGVTEAGGTPREFTTITVTDGIAMGHQGMKSSLVSRDLIADCVELTMRGHCYDALVGLAGCDKSLPGMMMAMLRLNVPSVFMYGGSILPGQVQGPGRDRGGRVRGGGPARGRQDVGRGPARAGMRRLPVGRRLRRAVHRQHHGDGQRGDRPGAARLGRLAGAVRGPRPLRGGIRPRGDGTCSTAGCARATSSRARRWRTPRWWSGATGGSTNAGLHLPAMAHEAGIRFTMDDVVEIMRRTPYIADLKPGGKYVALDVHRIGGIPVVLKALLDGGLLHGDCLTVTGKTMAENLKDVVFPTDQDVVYPVSRAISPTGGVVGLKGNLAPDGAIVKVAGMERDQLRFEGTALCFDSEEEAFAAVQAARLQAGRRHRRSATRGRRAGPGCARCCRPPRRSTARARQGQGRGADHRRPLLRRRRAASASAMSGRRRRWAGRSRCCATATGS